MEGNQIHCRDNLEFMRSLPSESIDLIYIDPPFFTQRKHKGEAGEFNDKWASRDEYLKFMCVRLMEMRRLLKNTGSIYVHLDQHVSHYVKVLMDSIFGDNNFRNEIIWNYQRWTCSSRSFQKTHDIVLFYSKYKVFIFNKIMEPYSEKSMHKSRRFSRIEGKKLAQVYTKNTEREKLMRDSWEISCINSQAKERTGYPTQKPEKLLERIITASSNPSDLVADFFCGSGTTLAVAKKLGRNYIGCDASPQAIEITKKRLESIP